MTHIIVDVSQCPRWGSFYDMTSVFMPEDDLLEYRDVSLDRPIWSVGQHKVTKKIHGSLDAIFYENPDYDCLWLR